MNDLRESGTKIETMDDMYNVVNKYAHLSRAKFDDMCKKLQQKDVMTAEKFELSDDELDAVAGGFDWKTFGIVVGCIAAVSMAAAGIGALGYLGYAAASTAYVAEGVEAVAMGYVEGATMWGLAAAEGAIAGGIYGLGGGIFMASMMQATTGIHPDEWF